MLLDDGDDILDALTLRATGVEFETFSERAQCRRELIRLHTEVAQCQPSLGVVGIQRQSSQSSLDGGLEFFAIMEILGLEEMSVSLSRLDFKGIIQGFFSHATQGPRHVG
jgi:hypothetical protein